MILMLFVVWLSILLSPTCSYCYKYSWNLYDDGNQYHHQKQQQQQPQHHYYQQQNQLPSDIMVDLINELGLKLLAIHNENNENNIALSPYGAFSVLVALGEGVRNEAAHEIVHAAHIPNDIRLVRVGLRDIHRHLKSYFIPKEGFLGGLTFNDDNVVLNTEYEMILRFYGYDVESFNNALYPGPATTQKPMTTTFNYALGQTDTTITTIPSVTTIISSTESSTTTMAPITTTKITEPSTTTTRTTETLTTTEKITNTTTEQMTSTTTEQMTSTATEQITSTTEKPENNTLHRMVPETTTQMETTSLKQEETTTETTTEGTTPARVSRQNLNTTESTISMEITGTTNIKQEETTIETTTINSTPITGSTSSLEETSTNFMSTEPNQFTDAVITSEDESTIEVPEENHTTEDINQTTESQTEYDDADYTSENDEQRNTIESSTTEHNEMTTMESSIRKKRSVVDYLIARYYDDHHYKPRNYYHHNYQPEEPFTFLVYNKYRETKINYMRYDTVLPFHYIPHLDALALSFPLDSSKYYLLLLLPTKERGIDKLICDLRLNTNLKYIIRNLRYTHVIATIPSFTLKGYVSLTSSIQKLGIRKVFEPRQADFSPMTTQSDIYVKNIEQAITVTIRNYVDPTLMEPYRNLHQTEPVYFKADHPFLYFVIDSELDVTLMAGKVVNPLNSRIS